MRTLIRQLVSARGLSATPRRERFGDVQSKVLLEEGICRLLRWQQDVHDLADGAIGVRGA